jgi:hypothetical protein
MAWHRARVVTEVSSSNFGLAIAFLVPGFTVLWGVSYFDETVRHWLSGSSTAMPTVGGFLYVTLASLAAGVAAKADAAHHPATELRIIRRSA